jgi:glucose-1-phosphate cytidylyltransferase
MRKDKSGLVTEFLEKPKLDGNSSAGYFVFEPEILDYLTAESTLETEPLANLALAGQLMAFTHDGFWEPMDTYREVIMLNSLWATGNAPWKADVAKRTSDNVSG